ncbi:hypothetical protein ADL30_03995 [Streptomyces sp. NRRL S-1521]|nr:hypothetical protein ADL30_03995 [Streptomyces sp. NRRL S-1521]
MLISSHRCSASVGRRGPLVGAVALAVLAVIPREAQRTDECDYDLPHALTASGHAARTSYGNAAAPATSP